MGSCLAPFDVTVITRVLNFEGGSEEHPTTVLTGIRFQVLNAGATAGQRLDAALPIRCTSAPGDSETPMLNMTELALRLLESHLAHTGACSESVGDSELPVVGSG
jgi:hypothetical protein